MLGRRAFLIGCACCAGAGFAAEAQSGAGMAGQALAQLPPQSITVLAPGVWSYTTWTVLNNAPFAANGVVVEGQHSVALIDTGWTDRDANAVLDLVAGVVGADKTILCIGTHAHADRIGGFEAVKARGVATYAHEMTQHDAPMRDLPLAQHTWSGRLWDVGLGGRSLEVFFPGPAHTRDNMTVWDGHTHTLFGGCMIRDMSWTSLGNVTDSNVPAWPGSIDALKRRYGARIARLVPGHGAIGGAELLDHTRALALAAAPAHS
jgi:glyoxylase-like metal-dependent hydrolase (beta-lactamase superfamily II)